MIADPQAKANLEDRFDLRAVDHPSVIAIAETQACLSREVADAYVRSVRKLLEP